MNAETKPNSICVELPISYARALLTLSNLLDEAVIANLRKSLSCSDEPDKASSRTVPSVVLGSGASQGRGHVLHVAEILGQRIEGETLPELYGRCVDLVHDLDASAVERLALIRSRARHYVARDRKAIHIKSPKLWPKTICTQSGWWISTNVSELQVTAALKALAQQANLHFGRDVKFPAQ